jgi:hypothetical protein
MRFRKLGVLVAAAVLASSGLYAPARGQVPSTYLPEALCLITGIVQLTDGGAPLEKIPPGKEDYGPETTTFTSIAVACAGLVTGLCPTVATGSTDQGSPTGGFAGSFILGPVPGLCPQTCSGYVGGPALITWVGATPTLHLPPSGDDPIAGVPPVDGSWSFIAGNAILGSLEEVNCTPGAGGVPPGFTDADGLLALTGTPIPVPVSSGCEDTDQFPPPMAYCSLAVAGVAVFLGESSD